MSRWLPGATTKLAEWGPQARWDDFALGSLLDEAEVVLGHTLLPLLVLAEGDRGAVEARHAELLSELEPVPERPSPRIRWRVRYRRFVREMEWLCSELSQHMAEAEVEKLVIDETAKAVERWAGFIKPRFASLYAARAGADARPDSLRARLGRTLEKRVGSGAGQGLFDRFNFAAFLVGDVEITAFDASGELEMNIPECAYHTVAGTGQPQTRGCLWVCKGACEKTFGEDSPLQLHFEPRVPDFGCTLRMRWDPERLRSEGWQEPARGLPILSTQEQT